MSSPSIVDRLNNFPMPAVFLTARQVERMAAYHQLLVEWNEKMNLVSRKSIDRAFDIHFVDSAAIALFGVRYGKAPYYDLGTGAGFPGLVFSCLFPDSPITLFERSTKKQTFLQEVVKVLELTQVKIEDEPKDGKKYEGTFFARAVLPDEEFFDFFAKTLKPGSLVVFNSGLNRELRVEPKGFLKVEEECYALPNDEGGRRCQLFLYEGSQKGSADGNKKP